MLIKLIEFSLRNRPFVLLAALSIFVWGWFQIPRMPVDVFPDLNRPTVTIMTEANGLAPEEVETLVTRPLEYALNGATGVQRVRSTSTIGLSIVWVEFDWNTDPYIDRQIVSEKLQLVRERLPPDTNPVLAPISSIMGEILLVGLRSRETPGDRQRELEAAMELRDWGEFTLRNRLLAIEGVSQVSVMGGVLRQYQIVTSPTRLARLGVDLDELVEAAKKANAVASGGIMQRASRESLLRLNGRSLTLDEIGNTPVVWREKVAIRIRDVADVRFGGPTPRGSGSTWRRVSDSVQVISNESGVISEKAPASWTSGGPAVILSIQKQPHANTLELDRTIQDLLDSLKPEFPAEIVLEPNIFRQASFIEAAIQNVQEALRDGALWVVVVLFLMMGNFRTSISSLVSMPLSIVLTLLLFHWLNISVNTMTLGGIAVAVGDLVDDSIVDIENIYRRLKLNRQLPLSQQRPSLEVVLAASCEIRNSIVYATGIVILVVCPLFAMGGLEGRIFAPLGLAYILSLLCSLLVSVTVTPVLGSVLLPSGRFLDSPKDPLLLRALKSLVRPLLRTALRKPKTILTVVVLLSSLSIASVFWMGGEFLPELNEGTMTVNLRLEPGTSLVESERIARQVELSLQQVPEVTGIARRTGRAELDEHAEGVHSSEMEVTLSPSRIAKEDWASQALRFVPGLHLFSYRSTGREREEVIEEIRDRISAIPGGAVNIGQPISHRLDHMMTGIRAQIAIKIFGPDLRKLRETGFDVQEAIQEVAGVVDLQIEPQVEISQVQLKVRRDEAARYGLAPGDVASLLETAYRGVTISQIINDDRYYELRLWYDDESRNSLNVLNQTIINTPSGKRVALSQVAEVLDTTGPNALNREGSQRRVVVFCNVAGRDLSSVVEDIRAKLAPIESRLRQEQGEFHIELGGQFEAQQEANRRLGLLAILSIVGVFLLLIRVLGTWQAALQVLVNVPLAAIGSVGILLLVNWPDPANLVGVSFWEFPQIWLEATTLSVAHWVGFVTLIGIVSRNGIMMISHYYHLMNEEGESFSEEMIIRGSLERLAPVMMTAMTSFIGLLPLLFGAHETGKEILHPLALVVFGGMLTSTILDQLVTPVLFFHFSGNRSTQVTRGD